MGLLFGQKSASKQLKKWGRPKIDEKIGWRKTRISLRGRPKKGQNSIWCEPDIFKITGLASLLASLCDVPRQCLNRQLVVAPERDSVVPKLVDEPRCSLCKPGRLRSFSWNQHRPRHLESPFTDDQHKSHLFFRFPLSEIRNPVTRGAPLPHHLDHLPSCAASSHHVSHHAELAP